MVVKPCVFDCLREVEEVVGGGAVLSEARLSGVERGGGVEVVLKALREDTLEQLPKGAEEGDRTEVGGQGWLGGIFGDAHDLGGLPDGREGSC